MAHFCWTCGGEQYFDVKVGVVVGRGDECIHCGADLKCCKNCRHYDPDVHNQCREPHTPFIRDRERSNFCTHFDFLDSDGPRKQADVDAAKAKLEALFKKPE